MATHVSIHDVSPVWEREIDVALALCAEAGVRPALLVVPDFHGKAPLGDHPAFCERLRGLQKEGHEIYLHGYYHRAGIQSADRSATGRLKHLFAQKVVSASEAEFSDVSEDEARHRLDDGERVLRDAGLRIDGFVAPAWSMPRWVMPLLAGRGYRFTEDHVTIHDPEAGTSRPSVVFNYASRTPARLLSSVGWCRIARPARHLLPARIAIHPADMRFALLRSEVASLLAWSRDDFVATGPMLFAA